MFSWESFSFVTGSQKKMVNFSFLCGIASLALILLRLTPLLGDSFGSILWFSPFAVIGIVTGIISYIKGQNRKKAMIAILISCLPMAFLLFLIFWVIIVDKGQLVNEGG